MRTNYCRLLLEKSISSRLSHRTRALYSHHGLIKDVSVNHSNKFCSFMQIQERQLITGGGWIPIRVLYSGRYTHLYICFISHFISSQIKEQMPLMCIDLFFNLPTIWLGRKLSTSIYINWWAWEGILRYDISIFNRSDFYKAIKAHTASGLLRQILSCIITLVFI